MIALLLQAPAPGPAGQAAINGGTPATIVVPTLWPTFANDRLRAAITGASRCWSLVVRAAVMATVSVGVTLIAPDGSLDDTLRCADEALYRAKHEGRNQVQVGLRVA